ncbi:LuxR C-terminal-related transcriptional regulator [Cyclobacterium sp. SYSU L10401]|uniref:LuxR C-terminal-related transcriptional regulator n=1 Tax=Cyclobacterium sp. SYSU L10401 TaxID=2678657 RepID=UPI0013D467DB|nr:LuxR C-terminal-related transcriptional regulator [Cyclobacterium sp. SYSU L10401]
MPQEGTLLNSAVKYFRKVSSTGHLPEAVEELKKFHQNRSHSLDLGPAFYVIIDYNDFSYRFVSKSFTEILGYDTQTLLNGGFPFFNSVIGPDEIQPTINLWDVITDYLKNLPNPVVRKCFFLVDFHFKHKNGNYLHMLQQTVILKTSSEGRLQYELVKITDITHWQKQSPMCGIIITPDPKDTLICFPTEDIQIKGLVFSKSELRILELMAMGDRSKEIAKKLKLSSHTVDTHRRNMLHKTHSKNTSELIRFAYLSGNL